MIPIHKVICSILCSQSMVNVTVEELRTGNLNICLTADYMWMIMRSVELCSPIPQHYAQEMLSY
jgi:hypothetical protein